MITDTIDKLPHQDTAMVRSVRSLSREGSMSDIILITYDSGETMVVKKAKRLEDNPYLRQEYKRLKLLNNDPKHPLEIPLVYGDFPPTHDIDPYGFQMQDLSSYTPLYDRASSKETFHTLELQTRLFILGRICACLHYLASKNLLHNDVQLSNILYSDDAIDVKIIDWGVCKDTTNETTYNDVQQLASIIPQLMGTDKLPRGIDIWLQVLKRGGFYSPRDALRDLGRVLGMRLL